jgi:hypothetical protein
MRRDDSPEARHSIAELIPGLVCEEVAGFEAMKWLHRTAQGFKPGLAVKKCALKVAPDSAARGCRNRNRTPVEHPRPPLSGWMHSVS